MTVALSTNMVKEGYGVMEPGTMAYGPGMHNGNSTIRLSPESLDHIELVEKPKDLTTELDVLDGSSAHVISDDRELDKLCMRQIVKVLIQLHVSYV
jgi:hypothetical protein